MKRTNIYLPEPALNRLTMIATDLDVSVASLIRVAIGDYLNSPNAKVSQLRGSEMVEECREMRRKKYGIRDIAQKFGITPQDARKILDRLSAVVER